MLLLHPEEVDPFISLAMLRDYLTLADANHLVEVSQLDQISLYCRQLPVSDQRFTLNSKMVTFPARGVPLPQGRGHSPGRPALLPGHSCHHQGPTRRGPVHRHKHMSPAPIVSCPCSREFPLRVMGKLSWWRIDPTVQAEPAPARYVGHPHTSGPTHMDHPMGLYSKSKKREWRQLQDMPTYKRTPSSTR